MQDPATASLVLNTVMWLWPVQDPATASLVLNTVMWLWPVQDPATASLVLNSVMLVVACAGSCYCKSCAELCDVGCGLCRILPAQFSVYKSTEPVF